MKKDCLVTVTEISLLDKDSDEESNEKKEPPDALGAHLPTPQRESIKRVWLKTLNT